jgi:hypothetical protein
MSIANADDDASNAELQAVKWMAPEDLCRSGKVQAKNDVYRTGTLMWLLIVDGASEPYANLGDVATVRAAILAGDRCSWLESGGVSGGGVEGSLNANMYAATE